MYEKKFRLTQWREFADAMHILLRGRLVEDEKAFIEYAAKHLGNLTKDEELTARRIIRRYFDRRRVEI